VLEKSHGSLASAYTAPVTAFSPGPPARKGRLWKNQYEFPCNFPQSLELTNLTLEDLVLVCWAMIGSKALVIWISTSSPDFGLCISIGSMAA
jgi:hypothetical protein